MAGLLPVAAGILGLLFGSFLNVCIFRIPTGESIVTGRSHCMACGTPIKPYDLVPVVSFLFLRGRCRSCGARISPRYPMVELLNAVLYVLLYVVFGLTPAFFLYAAFASALVVAAFIDIDRRIIPDRINLFVIIIGILLCFFSPDVEFYERIIGFFAVSLPFLIALLISKGGMGFGDVKLAAAAGLVIGYKYALFGLLIACVTGAVFGLSYAHIRGKSLKTAIPFCPFLAGGFCAALLVGRPVLSWYLGFFIK